MFNFLKRKARTYKVVALGAKSEELRCYGKGLTEANAYALFLSINNPNDFLTVADDDS